MYSNKIVHDELDEVMCPFCYEQMNERLVITKNYFDQQWLENKDHVIFLHKLWASRWLSTYERVL